MESNHQYNPERSSQRTLVAEPNNRPETLKPKPKPKGEVLIPALICGSVGTVLTTILFLINRYKSFDLSLKLKYETEPFLIQECTNLHGVWNWLLVLIVCFGISFAVLDSDRIWRRVTLFFLSLVIMIMASPVLMMWEVFWSPCMVVVGLLWSWFCAFIYSVQHTMPCELLAPARKIKQPKPAKPKKVKEAKTQSKVKSKSETKVKDEVKPKNQVFVPTAPTEKKPTVSNPLKVTPKFEPQE